MSYAFYCIYFWWYRALVPCGQIVMCSIRIPLRRSVQPQIIILRFQWRAFFQDFTNLSQTIAFERRLPRRELSNNKTMNATIQQSNIDSMTLVCLVSITQLISSKNALTKLLWTAANSYKLVKLLQWNGFDIVTVFV